MRLVKVGYSILWDPRWIPSCRALMGRNVWDDMYVCPQLAELAENEFPFYFMSKDIQRHRRDIK